MLWRSDRHTPRYLQFDFHIQANNETVSKNLFRFVKTVEVMNQYAEVIEVTNTTNMTDVYLDIWDGSVSKNLTSPGEIFSGMGVGSFFSKMKDNTEGLVLHFCDCCYFTELKADIIGQPFVITAKEGVDNFIRLNFTTNTILDFKIKAYIKYRVINDGFLFVVT